jgi:hypothetical protein
MVLYLEPQSQLTRPATFVQGLWSGVGIYPELPQWGLAGRPWTDLKDQPGGLSGGPCLTRKTIRVVNWLFASAGS